MADGPPVRVECICCVCPPGVLVSRSTAYRHRIKNGIRAVQDPRLDDNDHEDQKDEDVSEAEEDSEQAASPLSYSSPITSSSPADADEDMDDQENSDSLSGSGPADEDDQYVSIEGRWETLQALVSDCHELEGDNKNYDPRGTNLPIAVKEFVQTLYTLKAPRRIKSILFRKFSMLGVTLGLYGIPDSYHRAGALCSASISATSKLRWKLYDLCHNECVSFTGVYKDNTSCPRCHLSR